MVNPKYANIIFSFFMALFMSCIMSFVITLFNVGIVDDVVFIWLRAWSFAFVIAFPVINIVAPVVRQLVTLVVKPI